MVDLLNQRYAISLVSLRSRQNWATASIEKRTKPLTSANQKPISAIKLGEPKVFDLITDPKEEYPATAIRNTWNPEPALKIVADSSKA
jgi:hypothetical protein